VRNRAGECRRASSATEIKRWSELAHGEKPALSSNEKEAWLSKPTIPLVAADEAGFSFAVRFEYFNSVTEGGLGVRKG